MNNLWRYPLYGLIYVIAIIKAAGSHAGASRIIEAAMSKEGL